MSTGTEPRLRPLVAADVPAADALARRAFAATDAELGEPVEVADEADVRRGQLKLNHLLAHDPGGCIVAEADGAIVGLALALVRGGVWGLSLLVVDPAWQSAGLGRALLAAALAYGHAAPVGLIPATANPLAVRLYERAGFTLHPAMQASGRVRAGLLDGVQGVRPGRDDDLELAASVDRDVRGAARLEDLRALLAADCRLWIADRRGREGYVVAADGWVVALAARDRASARSLLLAALAAAPGQAEAQIRWLTREQDWAIEAALDAGLALRPGGPLFVRGRPDVPAPFLPSGAYP